MTTYLTDSQGKFIPPTQRPDGTWRKARRVKDGYVPQEEVPLYESKGKQYAQRKTGVPPGMCPFFVDATKKEREKQERAKTKKEAAVNNKKKQQYQHTPGVLLLPSMGPSSAKSNSNSQKLAISPTVANADDIDPEKEVDDLTQNLESSLNIPKDSFELDKKLKKLRKKLREIDAIEQKMKSGVLKKPDKDQLEKVKRKKDIIKEIEELQLRLNSDEIINYQAKNSTAY